MNKRLLLLVSSLIFLLQLPALAQDNPQQSWTPPKFLGDGWWQSMALDQEQRLHVAWYGSIESDDPTVGKDILMYTSKPLGGDWTSPQNIAFPNVSGWTMRSALSVTSDGILHAGIRYFRGHIEMSAPAREAEYANNWSSPVTLNNYGYYLDMTADSKDVLHYVYTALPQNVSEDNPKLETNTCWNCSDMLYKRSMDGGKTWTLPAPISVLPDSGISKPHIQQGASGRLYITWDEGYDWFAGGGVPNDTRLVYSDNEGQTWSDPILFKGDNFRKVIQGQFAELKDGTWMMVWRYNSESDKGIYYQLSSDLGKTWTDPTQILGINARALADTPFDRYELQVDHIGLVHLFLVGNIDSRSIDPNLYHMVYVPSSKYWTQAQVLYASPAERPEWPQALIGASNDIHLTWFNRGVIPGSDCNTCILKVYYSYQAGNMQPEPTRPFRPTVTPLPTATVFQNIQPTITPFPTLVGVNPELVVTTEDNYVAQTLLGGMFISALFCGAVAVFVRLRR